MSQPQAFAGLDLSNTAGRPGLLQDRRVFSRGPSFVCRYRDDIQKKMHPPQERRMHEMK
jgi:hypothetical protein